MKFKLLIELGGHTQGEIFDSFGGLTGISINSGEKINFSDSNYFEPVIENPIHLAIREKIKDLLIEDFSKSDIRERIKQVYPNFPIKVFEICYSEAFSEV